MGDFNKQICRLCLVISPTCECETIDEIKKEILQVLQINMDFDVSNCAVACNKCLERLHDCFDFKSRIITTLMDEINKTSQREMIGESLCLEKIQGCQLCMSLIKEEGYNYTTDLKSAVLLEDMIRNCFPEVDLNTHIHESHTCKQCVSGLERHYEFMKCCQEVEQKIVHFRQVANHCTADKVNLEDMLKFKDYDMLGTPIIIKMEYSDAENVDESATRCPKGDDIASIKCEEIHIKEELDNGVQTNDYGELRVHNSSGYSKSLKETTETRTSKNKKHFCHKCPYFSTNISTVKKHILTHSDDEVHGCNLCSFITNTRLSLRAHMTCHRGPTKRYGCPECTYETNYKSNLKQHLPKHKDNSEVKMYKCPSCPYKTKYKYHVMKHQKMLHKDMQEIPKYKCEVCDFETKYKCSLFTHMRTHEYPKVVSKFQCEKCPFKTKLMCCLKRHVTQVTHPFKYPYRVQTNDYGELRVHNSSGDSRSLKETTETRTSKNKKHFCHKCPYFSTNISTVKKHILTHSDDEVHGCSFCSFITNTKLSLQAHMASHRGPTKRYGCPECTYETNYKSNLKQHLPKHKDNSEVKMHKCPSCPYKTKYKYYIKKHQKMLHKDLQEIPKYKCEVCDYETKYKCSLFTHMRTHEDPKVASKFQCENVRLRQSGCVASRDMPLK